MIFAKAKLNNVAKSLIAGDLKVYNLLLAMSNNASTHPCGFCKSKRFEGLWFKGADLRTLEDKARLANLWIESGGKLDTRKDFFNCIGVPIVTESAEGETYVIDKFAIPTLHCILGTVNKVYHYFEENYPGVDSVSKKLGIVRDPFNNKDYNGNYCEKKNSKKFRSPREKCES